MTGRRGVILRNGESMTMKPRLVILIVAALGMAIFWASRAAAPPVPVETFVDKGPRPIEEFELPKRDLPGEEPETVSELSISYYIDSTGKKNRIYFSLDEANGFYVEWFELQFWYKQEPDTEYEDSVLAITHFVNNFIPAGGTLATCIEIAPGELDNTPDNSMGDTENWGADIVDWGRARAQNPDPLPPLKKVHSCD